MKTYTEEQAATMAFASQLRIATIILTGFSVVAALSTAVRIVRYARRYRGIESLGDSLEKGSGSLYPAGRNSYKGSDGDDRKWGWWKQWKIPPGEIYPLTLAIGIIVQGLMIVVEESTSTDRKGLNRKGIIGDCSVTSELTWAGIYTFTK